MVQPLVTLLDPEGEQLDLPTAVKGIPESRSACGSSLVISSLFGEAIGEKSMVAIPPCSCVPAVVGMHAYVHGYLHLHICK